MDYSGHAPTLEHRAPDYAEKIANAIAEGDKYNATRSGVVLSHAAYRKDLAQAARQGYMLGAGLSQ